MMDVEGALCVVAGGGTVAWRKIAGLLECGACVVVVSPDGVPELEAAALEGRLTWRRRPFRSGDLAGALLAFAAANDAAANAAVREEARREGVWLNAAYDAREGSFLVPSVVRRGRLVMAVTTGGASPKLARRIAAQWEWTYGSEYAAYVELLERGRRFALDSGAPEDRKLHAIGALLEFNILSRLSAGDSPPAVEADMLSRLAGMLGGPVPESDGHG